MSCLAANQSPWCVTLANVTHLLEKHHSSARDLLVKGGLGGVSGSEMSGVWFHMMWPQAGCATYPRCFSFFWLPLAQREWLAMTWVMTSRGRSPRRRAATLVWAVARHMYRVFSWRMAQQGHLRRPEYHRTPFHTASTAVRTFAAYTPAPDLILYPRILHTHTLYLFILSQAVP